MSKLYKVHQFAELSGVTVRALHYYDRIGLLKAQRSEAGYRMYAERDLERLEQIVALKFIGLGLGQIRAVLERKNIRLPDELRIQRQTLEEKQRLLARAIAAITDAEKEIRTGEPVDAAVLKKLIKAIQVQNQFDFLKQYYNDETLSKFSEVVVKMKNGPWDEWMTLGRDVSAALREDEDPVGKKAQELLNRSEQLLKHSPELSAYLTRLSTDPEILAAAKRVSTADWPAGKPSQIQKHSREVGQFLRKTNTARTKPG